MARERDPATEGVSNATIVAGWPGVQAVLAHRLAHNLIEAGVPFLPFLVSWFARAVTGVEIHPRAKIGRTPSRVVPVPVHCATRRRSPSIRS